MKLGLMSADSIGQIDGSVTKNILNHLPIIGDGDNDAFIVPVSWFPNYTFNASLETIRNKKIIICDFMEPHAPNEEYNKFWSWVITNPPILTFRRELLKRDASPAVKPIEWSCALPIPPLSKREDFDSRPIDVLFVWGYSNASRPKLHAEIMAGMETKGLQVVDNWQDLEAAKWKTENGPMWSHLWATIYSPYWRRKPLAEIVPLMQQAKITVSLPGNGKKTFRDTECVGTIIAMLDHGLYDAFSIPGITTADPKMVEDHRLAWAYDWNKTNSIQLSVNMFESLLEATRRTDLYELYCYCDEQMRKYEARTYVNNYVLPAIQSVL